MITQGTYESEWSSLMSPFDAKWGSNAHGNGLPLRRVSPDCELTTAGATILRNDPKAPYPQILF